MFKLVLEKSEEPEIKLPPSAGSSKKQEFQKNICFIDYAKAFDCVDHNKLWKILNQSGGAPAVRPGAVAQRPGREAALAWASLAQRFPASSVLARAGAGCGSVAPRTSLRLKVTQIGTRKESDMTE